MYTPNPRRRFTGGLIAIIASVVILCGAGWLYFNRQYVSDLTSVWSYQSTEALSTIEQNLRLTDKGSFYLRTTHPEIAGSDTFNQDCPRQEQNSPILGCYSSGRIYIYDISNQRLDGIKEVTAAHEMLHAVWQRTSESEKARLGTLLRKAYERSGSDALKERIAYYERTEPGETLNELHSIVPTELKDIGSELEDYYAQFFRDRRAVVAYHDQYSGLFERLSTQIETLYTQLQQSNTQLEAASALYDQDVTALSSDIDRFNTRATAGDFASVAEFNSMRAALLNRSDELESRRQQLVVQLEEYNQTYAEYQKLAGEIDVLNKSLDSVNGPQAAPAL